MKLYVWHDVLTDYTSGVMFALAESPEHARETIRPGWAKAKAYRDEHGEDGWQALPYSGPDCDRVVLVWHNIEQDLLGEPDAHEGPVGFAVWGGG